MSQLTTNSATATRPAKTFHAQHEAKLREMFDSYSVSSSPGGMLCASAIQWALQELEARAKTIAEQQEELWDLANEVYGGEVRIRTEEEMPP